MISSLLNFLFKLSKFTKLIRADKWWLYKLPPLLFSLYIFSYFFYPPSHKILYSSLGIILSLSGLGIFGFVINDIFDLDQDIISKKNNRLKNTNIISRYFLILLSILLGFIPWVFLDWGKTSLFLLIVNFLFPLTYSMPPFRIKERGALGIVWDSLGAIAIPFLFIIHALKNEFSIFYFPLETKFFIWFILFGIRGIISHQVLDLKNDLISNTKTFVTHIGVRRTILLVYFIVLPLEFFSIAILILNVSIYDFPLIYIFYFYLITSGFIIFLLKNSSLPSYINFLNPFYEIWLPTLILIELSRISSSYYLIFILHLILFHKGYINYGTFHFKYIKSLLKK